MTTAEIKDWVELILRWVHVFAGIMWVGATFYFTWLDGRFTELEHKAKDDPNKAPEKFVWMVHSGGFYLVEKQKNPQLLTQTLHWFKWEAATTWLTGFMLFGYMYYGQRGLLVNFEDPPISKHAAMGLSLGMIAVGWIVYDLLWKFCRKDIVGIVISYALIVTTAYISCRYFSGRGAYLQLGAMFGTIMAANVWMRILPAQRRMVAALRAGTVPNLEEGAQAKKRSKHNTFIVIPVVFVMISNHYPTTTYGNAHNWIILSAIVLVGWAAAKIIRRT
jgi:uncharacterized membrane protein